MSSPGADHNSLRMACVARMKEVGPDEFQIIQKAITSARKLTAKLQRLGVDIMTHGEERTAALSAGLVRARALNVLIDGLDGIEKARATEEGAVIDWPALRAAEAKIRNGIQALSAQE